jgi:hypothetical protein
VTKEFTTELCNKTTCHGPVERSEIRATQLALRMIHLGGPHARAMTTIRVISEPSVSPW